MEAFLILFGTNGSQEQQHFMYCRWRLCSPNYLCSPAKHQLAAKVVSTGNFSLLGCVTVLMGVSMPTLRRIVAPSPSESSNPITPQCLALNMNVAQSFNFGYYTELQPRIFESSATPMLWKPQIFHYFNWFHNYF